MKSGDRKEYLRSFCFVQLPKRNVSIFYMAWYSKDWNADDSVYLHFDVPKVYLLNVLTNTCSEIHFLKMNFSKLKCYLFPYTSLEKKKLILPYHQMRAEFNVAENK